MVTNDGSRPKELRVDCEFGSTGLWNEYGKNLRYSAASLPDALAARLKALQDDFNIKAFPPGTDDDAWWDWVEREEREIAQAIRAIVGPEVRVLIWRGNEWEPV